MFLALETTTGVIGMMILLTLLVVFLVALAVIRALGEHEENVEYDKRRHHG